MTDNSGTLFVVATPIGNLGDLTLRARETLARVDRIYAEDTRHSRKLLEHYTINTAMRSLHDHNEISRIPEICQHLGEGYDIAMISDAGTPLLSDPGFRVVQAVTEAGLPVSPIPGASALLAALSVAGQAVESFRFLGFPPAKAAACRTWLGKIADETATVVIYESPHRVLATLQCMAEVLGPERSVTVARELTKRHETICKTTIEQHLQMAASGQLVCKGEFVLVIAGKAESVEADSSEQELRRVIEILLKRLGARETSECAVELTGCRKNLAYRIALEMTDAGDV